MRWLTLSQGSYCGRTNRDSAGDGAHPMTPSARLVSVSVPHANKIRRIPADHSVRERLSRGEIAIVRRNGGYELVPAETAARIRERDERAVIGCGVAHDAVTTDGVPEDLMW